jgi:hypothetical protein
VWRIPIHASTRSGALRTGGPNADGISSSYGPVGELLPSRQKAAEQTAHTHSILSAPRYEELVTQIFVKGDPEVEQDFVFTGSDKMVGDFKKEGILFRLVYDFPLQRGVSTMTKAPIPA